MKSFVSTFFLFWVCCSVVMAEAYPCEESAGTHIWISPQNPKADDMIKIMAVSTDGPVTEMALIGGKEHLAILQTRQRGGPPWSSHSKLEGLPEGNYRIAAGRDGKVIACQQLDIGAVAEHRKTIQWNRAIEAFYSAWIEELFGAPHDEKLGFSSLEPILANTGRNFLHNFHRHDEDNNLVLTPDCADLPYILRAYFAWKMGLPFAYRACNRGSAHKPPQCKAPSLKTDFVQRTYSKTEFGRFNRLLADTVHSGAVRTALTDEETDLYPVSLTRETLWPGTVFADPYGHILMLVEWVPQTDKHPGMLLAADAQPDNSVARKRVWEGTLIFAQPKNAGAGFKAFRPLIQTQHNQWRVLTNEELADHADFASYSLEQGQLSADDFYARLQYLINPQGLEPLQAYQFLLDALIEQLETRVVSVNNGEDYTRKNPRQIIPMPSGAAIFQTVGPWEDYSTPSRDMRLMIAFNVLNDLPDRIMRYPELFMLHGKDPAEVKSKISRYHEEQTQVRGIQYIRSDNTVWELSLAEILARKPAFEMAYNPNDCVEKRWGAQPGTEEYAPCHRHAPAAQQAKMEQYRVWFRETRRPIQ